MEPKRSKYDTNPLDGKVADRATQAWGRDTAERPDAPTRDVSAAATREIGNSSNEAARRDPQNEAPTRRMDDSYPSVFAYGQPHQATYQPPQPIANIYQPPPVPRSQVYQPPPLPLTDKPGDRKIPGIGLQEKWALILPYLPIGFVIAIIAAVLELMLVPRNERRVRFHAAQGFVLQAGVAAISTLLGAADWAFAGDFTGAWLFRFASFIFLIVSMVRVWKGKPHHISLLDPLSKWIEEKINPRK